MKHHQTQVLHPWRNSITSLACFAKILVITIIFSSPLWAASDLPVIDQQAYIKASNSEEGDMFGFSLAISGDTLVVGAIYESSFATGVNGDQSDNSSPAAGAVYVFTRNGTVWSQQAYLKASNAWGGDAFGWSVAISGDTLVVGAYNEGGASSGVNGDQGPRSVETNASGAAYVFTRDGTVWSQQAYLKASNTGRGDRFGESVAISGGTIVVGASEEESIATGINGDQNDNSEQHTGAAYVFSRISTEWSQQAYLKASNTHGGEQFGLSVAISGDTIVVGATGVDGNQQNQLANNSGAAYVFTRNDNEWTQQAFIKASNAGSADFFGSSVALSGDTLVVGAVGEDGGAIDAGAAYVFKRSDVTWEQQAYLKASNKDRGDKFGRSVAIDNEIVIVGAPNENSGARGVNGDQGDGDPDNLALDSGAAYVFTHDGDVWTQQAYLKASNTDDDDRFGSSVDISGDTFLIGSFFEDSMATGINGAQTDNSGLDAGAVYVISPTLEINPGLNDAWYYPDTDGQGFFITVFPDLALVSLAWFTYDTELPAEDAEANLGDAGHRWLTALGPIEGNQVLMNIDIASGGIFDTATDIQHTDPPGSDGTIILTFDSCNSGTVEYDITSIDRQGTVPIQRVAGDNIALCEALNAD
jgi:hypothetical protein